MKPVCSEHECYNLTPETVGVVALIEVGITTCSEPVQILELLLILALL